MGANASALLYVIDSTPPTDSNSYLTLRPESDKDFPLSSIDIGEIPEEFPTSDKSKLLYHINKLTNVHHLCISPSVALDIRIVAHGEGYLRFSCCYKIIIDLWCISGLIKLLCAFIRYCCQCLALQTRWHASYDLLQTIESYFVPFFTLTIDFVLALPSSKEKYNALMSMTCKFSKQAILIKDADSWSAE